MWWEYLEEKYEAKFRDFKKLVLLKKIVSIKKEDNENYGWVLYKDQRNINQVEGIDFLIFQELVILIVLNSLPTLYNIFIKLLIIKDIQLSLKKLESKLMSEELQIQIDV